nr:protein kinase [Kofleriaceae bacterium]
MSAGAPEVFGPYTVFEELGVGGMASVHRAEMRGEIAGFTHSVALKRMLPQCAVSTDFVAAFVREARIASHLRHINVAQTFELGKVDGIYFIAMELVPGKNLRQVLRHCAQMTGPMPVAVTLNILNQICDALDYAHNLADETGQPLGIIHRDVSPSNIIVSDEGVVKLIDFGIAKASAAGMQTTSGMLKGKFGYMAPEYIAGSIDARADLWALGVIAHELLTNRPLFTAADDMDTLTRVRDMKIKPPSARNAKVPPEIDDIVMTALQRDPAQRWQQATALRAAMTTMTKRLGMACQNHEVSEWLEWAFRQVRPVRVEVKDEDTTGVRHGEEATATPTTIDQPPDLDMRRTTRQDKYVRAHSASAPQSLPPRSSPGIVPPSAVPSARGSTPPAELAAAAGVRPSYTAMASSAVPVPVPQRPSQPMMRAASNASGSHALPPALSNASGSHALPPASSPRIQVLPNASPNPAIARVPTPNTPPAGPLMAPAVVMMPRPQSVPPPLTPQPMPAPQFHQLQPGQQFQQAQQVQQLQPHQPARAPTPGVAIAPSGGPGANTGLIVATLLVLVVAAAAVVVYFVALQ